MRGYICGSIYVVFISITSDLLAWNSSRRWISIYYTQVSLSRYGQNAKRAFETFSSREIVFRVFYPKRRSLHLRPEDSDSCRGWIWYWWLLAVMGKRWGVDEWDGTSSWWCLGSPARRSSASRSRLKEIVPSLLRQFYSFRWNFILSFMNYIHSVYWIFTYKSESLKVNPFLLMTLLMQKCLFSFQF